MRGGFAFSGLNFGKRERWGRFSSLPRKILDGLDEVE